MKPRKYQIETVDEVFHEWRKARSVLLVCPTAGGKTFMFCMAAERRRPKGRVLILADRIGLVDQALRCVPQYTSLSVAVEMGDEKVNLRSLPDVVVASVQTMTNRLDNFANNTFATVIFDEADLALAPTYRKVLDHFGRAKLLGVTATPKRGDGQALSQLFEAVVRIKYTDLMPRYISRIRQQWVKVLDLARIKVNKKSGDYDESVLDDILTEEKTLHEVVCSTRDLAGDRQTLVFAPSVESAQLLAELFNRYKLGSAKAIDGTMSIEERKKITEPFEAGRFQFLCNCAVLQRGIDLPIVSCISMARPTMSRTLYEQMLGRGMRLHPRKCDLLVLDFVDNSLNNSLVEDKKVSISDGKTEAIEPREKAKREAPRTINAVDVIYEDEPEEIKVLVLKMLEDNPGSDIINVVAEAKRRLAGDKALRALVLATVKARQVREVGLGIDWETEIRAGDTIAETARRLGVSYTSVRENWPIDIPKLSRSEACKKRDTATTPEQRSERARRKHAAMTPEQRSEITRKGRATLTPEQRSEIARKMNSDRARQMSAERIRKRMATLTTEQRTEMARNARAAQLTRT